MDDEIKSLHANQTWTTEPILKGVRAFPVKWVYKAKDANGILEQFKARLVARVLRVFASFRALSQVSRT